MYNTPIHNRINAIYVYEYVCAWKARAHDVAVATRKMRTTAVTVAATATAASATTVAVSSAIIALATLSMHSLTDNQLNVIKQLLSLSASGLMLLPMLQL